jgi:hypothetical protein
MFLHIYVGITELGDYGRPIILNDEIELDLVGNPGSTAGIEVFALDTYLANQGVRSLRRTGLAEYAFSGRILDVKSRRHRRIPEIVRREILLDCGIPVIFATQGIEGISPLDVDQPTNKQPTIGRFLSGLMILQGSWSIREPPLVSAPVRAKIASLAVVDLFPRAEPPGRVLEREAVETRDTMLPIIMGIEVMGQNHP